MKLIYSLVCNSQIPSIQSSPTTGGTHDSALGVAEPGTNGVDAGTKSDATANVNEKKSAPGADAV